MDMQQKPMAGWFKLEQKYIFFIKGLMPLPL